MPPKTRAIGRLGLIYLFVPVALKLFARARGVSLSSRAEAAGWSGWSNNARTPRHLDVSPRRRTMRERAQKGELCGCSTDAPSLADGNREARASSARRMTGVAGRASTLGNRSPSSRRAATVGCELAASLHSAFAAVSN